MNGRMYDPVIGRVLSPDKVVQAPGYTQSYNRYSYCMNNPLKYMDPNGWYVQAIPGGYMITGVDINMLWNDIVNLNKHGGGGGGGGSFSAFCVNLQGVVNSGGSLFFYSRNNSIWYRDSGGQPTTINDNSAVGALSGFTVTQNVRRTNSVVEFIDGFLDPEIPSNTLSISNTISGFNILNKGVEGALRDEFSTVTSFTDRRVVASSIGIGKKLSTRLGVLGAVVTGVEGLLDKDGLTWGDGLKVGVGLATMVSYGWIYGIVDLGVSVTTGTSITDRLGSGLDRA